MQVIQLCDVISFLLNFYVKPEMLDTITIEFPRHERTPVPYNAVIYVLNKSYSSLLYDQTINFQQCRVIESLCYLHYKYSFEEGQSN